MLHAETHNPVYTRECVNRRAAADGGAEVS